MFFFSDFFKALNNCRKAFGLLFEKGFWPYMIYPLIIWLVLWIFSIYGIFRLADHINAWLTPYFSFDMIPDSGHWLSFAKYYLVDIFSFIIGILLKIILWFITGTFIKYLLLIVLSPLFSLLSEKTEERLTGKKFAFSGTQLIADIFRGIVISLRNMLMEFLFILFGFILTLFFPPLFIITTPLLLFVGWYYIGFTLIDYNCERHKLRASDSLSLIKRHKGYACGIGFVYSIFLALPFFPGGIIGMMFGPALATIAGTISFLEINGQYRVYSNPVNKSNLE